MGQGTEVEMVKRALLSLLLVVMVASMVGCGGSAVPKVSAQGKAPAEVVAARDAAVVFVREHYDHAPQDAVTWTEEKLTPEGLVGGVTWQYSAEDWVITVAYAVVAPEWTVYRVEMSNESTGFTWEGRVDGSGRVPEAPEDALLARDTALLYVSEQYGQVGLGAGLAWQEERLTPEGIVGGETYQYTAGDWVATVAYPVVLPENSIYTISVINTGTGFQWEGEVDSQGAVTQLGVSSEEGFVDRVAARDAALNFIYDTRQYPSLDASVEWTEERLTAEGIVGAETFKYTAENWVVEISYPVVAPDATIYEIRVTNDHLGFEWQGTVDAYGVVTEGEAAPSGDVIYGEATVEDIDVLILESFPVQVNVLAHGYLSDACTEIDDITQQRRGKTFLVTITTARPVDAVCLQAVTEFEEVISLEVLGLQAGTYTVDVNGVTGSFQLEMDNVAPEQ